MMDIYDDYILWFLFLDSYVVAFVWMSCVREKYDCSYIL